MLPNVEEYFSVIFTLFPSEKKIPDSKMANFFAKTIDKTKESWSDAHSRIAGPKM
jgi:hypothetical protein